MTRIGSSLAVCVCAKRDGFRWFGVLHPSLVSWKGLGPASFSLGQKAAKAALALALRTATKCVGSWGRSFTKVGLFLSLERGDNFRNT